MTLWSSLCFHLSCYMVQFSALWRWWNCCFSTCLTDGRLSPLRGPDGVKIENADGAVATVTGLQVGEYEFSLTVTDERDLASTETVTVIVREGNSPLCDLCVCLFCVFV